MYEKVMFLLMCLLASTAGLGTVYTLLAHAINDDA